RSACAAYATPASAAGCAAQSLPSALSQPSAIHLNEVRHSPNLTLQLRTVLPLHSLANPPKPKRLKRRFLARVGPVGATNLLDRHEDSSALGSSEAFSSAGASSAFGSSVVAVATSALGASVDSAAASAGGAVGGTAPEDALATGGGGGSPAATGPAASASEPSIVTAPLLFSTPSTCATVSPRNSATSSGLLSRIKPSIVALTR